MDKSDLEDKLSQIINAIYIKDEQGNIYVKNLAKDNSKITYFRNPKNSWDNITFNNKLDDHDIPKIIEYIPTSNNAEIAVEYSRTNPFNDNDDEILDNDENIPLLTTPLLTQENNSWKSNIKESLKSKYDYINEKIIKPIMKLTRKIKRRRGVKLNGSWRRRSHGGKTRKKKRSVRKKSLK